MNAQQMCVCVLIFIEEPPTPRCSPPATSYSNVGNNLFKLSLRISRNLFLYEHSRALSLSLPVFSVAR